MNLNKKKKAKKSEGDASASFAALAALTSSDVVAQVKFGMSRLTSLEETEPSEDSAR